MPIVAAAIDVASRAFFRSQNLRSPIIESGGALYAGCIYETGGAPAQLFGIFKSTDGGATWALQDGANSIDNGGNITFNGISTITACTCVVSNPGGDAIKIYEFDCTTDTWSTIAVGGPVAQSTNAIWKRLDGSYVVLFDAGNPNLHGGTRMWMVVYDAGWISLQDAGVNSGLVGVTVFPYPASSAIDSSDRIHLCFFDGGYTSFWYQAIEPDNSLGAFFNFTGNISITGNQVPLGGVAIVGDQIVVAVGMDDLTLNVWRGNGLSAPVWTLSPQIGTIQPYGTPQIVYDPVSGTAVLYCTSSSSGLVSDYVVQFQTANTVNSTLGWGAGTTVYDVNANATPPNFDTTDDIEPIQVGLSPGTVYLGGAYQNTIVGNIGFYIGSIVLSGIVPPVVNPADNPRIAAQMLLTIGLPRLSMMDNTGAKKSCFPMKRCKL